MTFVFIFILGFWSLFFLAPKNRTKYAYDNSNWLTQVVYPNADVVNYAYNDAGDRISEQLNDRPAVVYEYDAAGRMISKGAEAYSYDADGNMLTDSEASYTWNSDNRLTKIETAVGGCKHDKDRKGFGYGHLKHGKEAVVYEEYTYLPQDWRRVTRKAGKYSVNTDHKGNSKKDAEAEQEFISIYDGDDESHEYLLTEAKLHHHGKHEHGEDSLKLFREFIGGPAADDIEHTRYGKLSFAMLKDGLGSTIALTGRNGKAIAHIGYDAWGNFRYSDKFGEAPCKYDDFDNYLERLEGTRGFGQAAHNSHTFGQHFATKLTPYLYTGRRHSELANQYFNRNRYYSPALGRFISKDPISFNGGNNLYRYADNNPMLFTDPWGLKKVIDWLNPIPLEPQDYIYDPTWHLEYDAVRYINGIVAQEISLDYIWIQGENKARVTTQQWESRFAKDIVALENWAYVLRDDEDDCFVPQKGIGPHSTYYFNTLVEEVSFDRIGTRIGKTDVFEYSKTNRQALYPQRMESRRDNPRSPYWVKTKLAELEKIISEFETALLR